MHPQKIGKYILVGKIGEGAMGEVFKAQDPHLNRFVALKMIGQSFQKEPDLRKRFEREAQSAAQLNHPNIVTIYDFGEEQGKIFMAMELLEGSDLRDLLRAGKTLSLEQKLRLMEQVAEGLAFAHGKGIVHRDIKPGNIYIQPNGQVKILDFGLARVASSDMTRTGLVMGTPNYMSPEQVQGQHVDTRSDVFSLGAVFYELLTNHKPFSADSVHATMFKVVQGEREPLEKWDPALPASVVALVDRMLAKDPASRFADAAELRDVLRSVRKELGVEADQSQMTLSQELLETMMAPSPSVVGSRSGSAAPTAEGSGSRGTVRESEIDRRSAARKNLLIWSGAALAAILIGGYAFFSSSPPAGEVPAASSAKGDAVGEALLATQLELARTRLEAKNYQGALELAEAILASAPDHPEAASIRDEARSVLREVDTAAEEARAALRSGRAEEAAQALSRVMAIDPSHPVAAELSSELDRHFRSLAERARSEMEASRRTARSAGASATEAERLAGQAEADFSRGEFTRAAQSFLGARDRFDQARRAAEQSARRAEQETAALRASLERASRAWAEARSRAAEDVRRQPSFEEAVALAADAERLEGQGDLPGATNAYQQAVAQVEEARSAARREAEAREAAARRAAAAPPPPAPEPAPPTSTAPPPVSDDEAIRRVIANWERAIETKDIALYKSVKPNLTADEERRLAASFAAVKSHHVEIDVDLIEIRGGEATVSLTRQDTLVIDGTQKVNPIRQTVVLIRQGNGWVIREIGQ